MKKLIALILAALLALSTLTAALAAAYTDKDTVKKVQQALNDAGYSCGTPDGVAGKKTVAAITQYQTDKGLEATGTIDDALLEAMGLDLDEPGDAQAANASSETESGQAEDNTLPENDDPYDPKTLAAKYNAYFLLRLQELGIDNTKEDIGQEAYIISGIYDEGWGYSLLADKVNIVIDFENNKPAEYYIAGGGDNTLEELSFLDHAAVYAFLKTANEVFNGNESDLTKVLEALGDPPERDGAIPHEEILFNHEPNDDDSYWLSYLESSTIRDVTYYRFIVELP